jgi:hypothetical protein
MDIYENDPDQTGVFTYELSKVCNHLLDNWCYADGILTIDLCSAFDEPDPHKIKDRVRELCAWQDKEAVE